MKKYLPPSYRAHSTSCGSTIFFILYPKASQHESSVCVFVCLCKNFVKHLPVFTHNNKFRSLCKLSTVGRNGNRKSTTLWNRKKNFSLFFCSTASRVAVLICMHRYIYVSPTVKVMVVPTLFINIHIFLCYIQTDSTHPEQTHRRRVTKSLSL